MISLKTIRS